MANQRVQIKGSRDCGGHKTPSSLLITRRKEVNTLNMEPKAFAQNEQRTKRRRERGELGITGIDESTAKFDIQECVSFFFFFF